MKKLLFFAVLLLFIACNTKKGETEAENTELLDNDSTLYGICGEGCAMHTLQLIDANNDTLYIHIDDEDSLHMTSMAGSMHIGDRMAVTTYFDGEGLVASKMINITSLLGHWKSVDRDFELTEDGEVKSFLDSESDPWTTWRILNGQLLLNDEAFDVVKIEDTTLELENGEGIYTFNRVSDEVEPAEEDSTATE